MKRQRHPQPALLQLQEVCQRLDVPYRDARYLCERGWLPAGVARQPGRGNHRQLTLAQAVWLGVVLRLKACGVQPRAAAAIASFKGFGKGPPEGPCGGWPYPPCGSAPGESRGWSLEVGDMRFLRVVTGADRCAGGPEEGPWVEIESGKPAREASPIVSLRIDVAALARLLDDLPG